MNSALTVCAAVMLIYEVGVTRDSSGHIIGFSSAATLFATDPYIDGGLTYGPGGDLFYTAYPTNQLGEIMPGSTSPDKTVDLGTVGITSSAGGVEIAPNGNATILSYSRGGFYDVSLSPDGSGTYNVTSATLVSTPGLGPEAMVFVPAGSPLFTGGNWGIMTEYGTGTVGAYPLDGNYDLQPSGVLGRIQFADLSGAEGAVFCHERSTALDVCV